MFLRSERSYDLVLVSEFLTREDLATYSQHPAHVKVVEEVIKPCLAGIAVVDYEK